MNDLVDCAKKNQVERKLTMVETELRINNGPNSEVGGESPMYFFFDAFKMNQPWVWHRSLKFHDFPVEAHPLCLHV